MNRKQRRSKDLYTEVTGRNTVLKKIPVSKIKVDESKLDQELLQKLISFESIKDSLERDVYRISMLMLNYLDDLCTLPFAKLASDEKQNAITLIDLVNNSIKGMLDGCVLSDPDEVQDRIKNVAKFSLTCFEGTDIPLLTPICDRAIQLIDYEYVVGGRIGASLGYHSSADKFTTKDIECIKEYAEFLKNKSFEIKAKN